MGERVLFQGKQSPSRAALAVIMAYADDAPRPETRRSRLLVLTKKGPPLLGLRMAILSFDSFTGWRREEHKPGSSNSSSLCPGRGRSSNEAALSIHPCAHEVLALSDDYDDRSVAAGISCPLNTGTWNEKQSVQVPHVPEPGASECTHLTNNRERCANREYPLYSPNAQDLQAAAGAGSDSRSTSQTASRFIGTRLKSTLSTVNCCLWYRGSAWSRASQVDASSSLNTHLDSLR